MFLGVFIWAGVAALCALVLKGVFEQQEFLEALAAMLRPLVLVLVAGFLLFFNDQGRELGVSLVIDDDGWLRLVFLFLALIYWGLNNWHTASSRDLRRDRARQPPLPPDLLNSASGKFKFPVGPEESGR